MSVERDETLDRVRAALKPLPPADAHAVARVLSAVHGRTPQPTPRWREFLDWMRMPSLSVAATGGVAVAALFVGYIWSENSAAPSVGGPNLAAPATATSGSATSGSAASGSATSGIAPVAGESLPGGTVPTVPVAAVAEAERLVPWQFVLDLPSATSVAVVGDFNDWNLKQAPMQKFASGAWSITVAIKPGRHEYAFVVDGKLWMADPRAPKARDNDFGKPGSVIVVNTP